MYATINLPGSTHFRWFGPASRQECWQWLDATSMALQKTEQVTSLLPQQIISNKEAAKWRWRDGSKVFNPGALGHDHNVEAFGLNAATLEADRLYSEAQYAAWKAEQRAEDERFFAAL